MGNILSFLTKPFTAIVDGVIGFFSKRQDIVAAEQQRKDELKQAVHTAEVERIKRGDNIEANYDIMAMKNAQNSIIDEIMIFWVLGVVTCLFIPALAPFAVAGFTALSEVPVWFQLLVVGCYIARLGLRFLFSGRSLFGKKI